MLLLLLFFVIAVVVAYYLYACGLISGHFRFPYFPHNAKTNKVTILTQNAFRSNSKARNHLQYCKTLLGKVTLNNLTKCKIPQTPIFTFTKSNSCQCDESTVTINEIKEVTYIHTYMYPFVDGKPL